MTSSQSCASKQSTDMKWNLLLCVVTLTLGTASACDLTRKKKCIDDNKRVSEGLEEPTDKCLMANDVRKCVFINAQCPQDVANAAASTLVNELSLDCNEDPTWEKMGRCLTRFAECEQTYNQMVREVKGTTKIIGVDDTTGICQAIEAFQKCASTKCEILPINYEMSIFMRRAGIDECENIHFKICERFEQVEECLVTYNHGVIKLDVKGNPKEKCRLVEAVELCLHKKAKCLWEITRRIMKELLKNLDCSQYSILCDQEKLEDCIISHQKLDNCGKMKAFGDCLSKNASCPVGLLDNILRQVKDENHLDCDSPINNEEKPHCDCQKSTEL